MRERGSLSTVVDYVSGTAQMSLLQDLPSSLCEPGPEEVDGVGNFSLQILDCDPEQTPLSTLYFLDSHGQVPSETANPDYEAIKESQIDWFTRISRARRREHGKDDNFNHLSMVFQHIPLPEMGGKTFVYSRVGAENRPRAPS